jgi:hypothetical protein
MKGGAEELNECRNKNQGTRIDLLSLKKVLSEIAKRNPSLIEKLE